MVVGEKAIDKLEQSLGKRIHMFACLPNQVILRY